MAGETISDGLLIAMVLKGLPPTVKPFTTVITQKDKKLTFTEYKTALRSYEETEKMCTPQNQGNNVMQLRTSFKKFRKPVPQTYQTRNYDIKNKGLKNNYYNNNWNSNNTKTNIVCFRCGKAGHVRAKCQFYTRNDFCKNVKTFSNGRTYAFSFGLDTIPNSYNSYLVDTGATNHVITDETKFINFDPNFEPDSHFIELADGTRANNLVLKRGDACIYLRDTKGNICKCLLKRALYIPKFKQNIFSVQSAVRTGVKVNFH